MKKSNSSNNRKNKFSRIIGIAAAILLAAVFINALPNLRAQAESNGSFFGLADLFNWQAANDSQLKTGDNFLVPPNDTFATAITLTNNSTVGGFFDSTTVNDYVLGTPGTPTCFTGTGQTGTGTTATGPGRDVVYSFTAPAAGNYTFRVANTGASVAGGGNLVIYLVDGTPTGTAPISIPCQAPPGTPPVAFAASNRNSSSTEAAEAIYNQPLTSGQQVFLVIDEGTAAQTSAINFIVEVKTTNLETEPANNTFPGQAIDCIIEGAVQNTAAMTGQDADFYNLGAQTDASRLFAIVDGGAGSFPDFDLRVNNATQTIEFDDAENDTINGGSSPSILGTPLASASGPFALQVDTGGTSSAVTVEPYRLAYVVQPPIELATAEAEPNETVAQANGATNNYFSGTFTNGTDVDVYGTAAQAGDLLFVGVDTNPNRNLTTATAANASFDLLDSNGNIIYTITGGSTTLTNPFTPGSTLTSTTPVSSGESLLFRVPTTGVYYVRLTQVGSVANAPYLLSISKNCQTGGGGLIVPGSGTLQFNTTNISGSEGSSVTLTVTRSGGNTGAVTVNYATGGGTATGGATCAGLVDYQTTSGLLTFAEGVNSQTITIQLCADGLNADPGETFNVTLSNPTGGATIGTANPAIVTILDTASQFCNSDGTITTTNTGTAPFPSTPYPSINAVSGLSGTITGVRVTLNNISHTFPDDLDILLVSPSGQNIILMSDAGGGDDLVNTTLTFSDTAATQLPDGTLISSGSYKPSNFTAANDVFATGAPAGPYGDPGPGGTPAGTATLASIFNGTAPNGTWQLFVSDDAGGDVGTITSWCLEITTNAAPVFPTVQFSSATYAGSEGTSATITVTRTGDTTGASSVMYATAGGGGATGGATCDGTVDFINASGTLNFAAGSASETFTVQLCTDAFTPETGENVGLTLSNPVNATLGTPNTATLTITDVAPAPAGTIQFSATTFSVGEGGGNASLTVTRTGGSNGAISATYSFADSGATGGATCGGTVDYVNTGGTVTFADGNTTSQTILVPICDDAAVEGNENFTATLAGANVGTPATTTVTITDNDVAQPGVLALSSATYSVGEAGGSITVNVNRTGGSDGAVSVNLATSPGTATGSGAVFACEPGVDYLSTNGIVSFADGQTTQTFTIGICNDTVLEDDETFNLTLSNPSGSATIGSPATAVVTIVDDEVAQNGTIQFSAATYTVSEAGPTALITVTRTGGSDGSVMADFATVAAGSTATNGTSCGNPGVDYLTTIGTVTFGNGVTTPQTFTIPICNDVTTEPDETVNLALSNPTGGATLGTQNTAVLTINDNDAAGVSVTPTTVNVAEGGATATYSVVLNTQPTADVTITITPDSQVMVSPTTLTFTAANFSVAQTVTVTAVDDAAVEGNHTGTITQTAASSDANYNGVSVASVTANITDNDVADMTAPVITYAPLSSTNSTAARTITATITDAVGVTTATVFYRVNSGTYSSTACTLTSGTPQNGTYDCVIPGQAMGSAVSYYITATDAAGNIGSNPTAGADAPNLYSVGNGATIPAGTYTNLNVGSEILGGNVTVNDSLTLNGILDAGANTLTLGCNTVVTGAGAGSYVVGSVAKQYCTTGSFTYPVGTTPDGNLTDGVFNSEYSPFTANVTAIGIGQIPSTLTVSVVDGFLPGSSTTQSASRYWNVTETGEIRADISYVYLAQDVNGNESTYQVLRSSGGTTAVYPDASNPGGVGTVNPETNTATATNVINFSQWGAGNLAALAASVDVGGRVMTSGGRGIAGARIYMTDLNGNVVIRRTNSSGYYRFIDVSVGETYVLTVQHKTLRFAQPTLTLFVSDENLGVNFISNGQNQDVSDLPPDAPEKNNE